MAKLTIAAASALTVLLALASPASAQLSVTFDSGLGTSSITDVDNDGSISFDTTIDGIFRVQGVVKEQIQPLKAKIAIAPLLPFTEALFRNDSASPQTFTVTVRSRTLTTPIGLPLGWDAFYNGTADDLTDASVDIPAHSVAGAINNGMTLLGTATGTVLSGGPPLAIVEEQHGVDPAATANDVVLVWTMQIGAHDEIRLPTDDDFEGESIQVNVFNQSQKCVDKMNSSARNVANTAQKSDQKCMKTEASDVTACVDEPADEKTETKETKLTDLFASQCDPLPAWGANGDSCCNGGTGDGTVCADSSTCGGGTCTAGECIAAAADAAANEVAHDLFGASVVISADKPSYKCQQAVFKKTAQVLVERWKQFRSCKRDNFETILDDTLLKSTCLEPQPDPKNKIAKRTLDVTEIVQAKCLDQGLSGLGSLFPGGCSAVADGSFGACAAARAACRFCESANTADDVVPPVDCDAFDDAAVNGSCP